VLAAAGVTHTHLGIEDHTDVFAQPDTARAWATAVVATPDVPVLVHCHMGVNRSASAAVVLLVARGVPVADAMHAVLTNRAAAMAVYAPATLRAWGTHGDADTARDVLFALRGEDRRLRDVTIA
jgi:protein-tyrosine phosphatase